MSVNKHSKCEWHRLWQIKLIRWTVEWNEIKWNMNDKVCRRKWDKTWTMKCGLKEMRWNMNNKVDNVRVFTCRLVADKCYHSSSSFK